MLISALVTAGVAVSTALALLTVSVVMPCAGFAIDSVAPEPSGVRPLTWIDKDTCHAFA